MVGSVVVRVRRGIVIVSLRREKEIVYVFGRMQRPPARRRRVQKAQAQAFLYATGSCALFRAPKSLQICCP